MAEPAVAGKDKNSAEEFELVYYKGDAGEAGTNAKITGLPYKAGYKFVMQFKIKDASKKEITVKVYPKDGQTIEPSDWEKPNFDSCYKLNNITHVRSSAGDKEITWGSKESDGSYIGTVEFPVGTNIGDWGNKCLEFGVTGNDGWNKKYVGATITENGAYVELTPGNGSNNKCTTIVSGTTTKKVTIYIKSTADKLHAKIITE